VAANLMRHSKQSVCAARLEVVREACDLGTVVKDHEIILVLHHYPTGLPAVGPLVARQQVANLAFAHEFQRRYRDHTARSPGLSNASGSRVRANPATDPLCFGLLDDSSVN